MVRVLWLSHFLPFPPKGGSFQRSFHLLRGLAGRHEVHYLGLHKGARASPSTVRQAAEAMGAFCASFHTIPMRHASGLGLISGAIGGVARGTSMGEGILRQRDFLAAVSPRLRSIDIVHCDTFEMVASCRGIREMEGLPSVAHFHNVESEIAARIVAHSRPPRKHIWRLEGALLRRLERQVVTDADLTVAVSARDAEHLEAIGAKRVAVVENGVDLDYFRPALPGASPAPDLRVVWIGGMDWFPNRDAVQHLVHDVWPSVHSQVPDAELVIVGRRPAGFLEEFRQENALRVRVTGFVDDARPYFHGAAAFVVPVRIGGGSRLKILDAMACGAPVVSTMVGAEGLAVEDGRHALLADTDRHFAAAVVRLLRDVELRRRLGTEGRRLVETRYSWDALAMKMAAAYEATVSEAAAAVQRR